MSDRDAVQSDPTIKLVVQLAEPAADDRVLDVGTTVGALAFALHGIVTEVEAVDDRQDTIDEALRLQSTLAVTGIRFSRADLYALPFPDDAFSLVVCRNTIHRFREPVEALREMARVMRPGGRLVLSDVVVSEALDRPVNELARLADSGHRRHCLHDEFVDQFEKAGLKVTAEKQDRSTVDLEFWLEAAAVDHGHAGMVRARLQEFPLKVQSALDLVVADRLVSFSYDVIAFRLERA